MGTKNAKTRKVGEYEKLDRALYIWFHQQRDKNIPVSGPLLLEKARILYVKLYGDSDKQFTGSTYQKSTKQLSTVMIIKSCIFTYPNKFTYLNTFLRSLVQRCSDN